MDSSPILGGFVSLNDIRGKLENGSPDDFARLFRYHYESILRGWISELPEEQRGNTDIILGIIQTKHEFLVRVATNLNVKWRPKKLAQEAIDELIGCDAKEFELTNYFKRKETGGFMELSAPDKQKYMMKWFKNTHWIELHKSVSKDLSDK